MSLIQRKISFPMCLFTPSTLETVRGSGYRFTAQVPAR